MMSLTQPHICIRQKQTQNKLLIDNLMNEPLALIQGEQWRPFDFSELLR